MQADQAHIVEFREIVWEYYHNNARTMPWRDNHDAHVVMVSEVMLQQTQVERVKPKFEAFLERFPTVKALAEAPLSEVLTLWSGLGYNRRAKFLWQAARMVQYNFNGMMPTTIKELQKLPGVGINTAGAIMAYAYDQPVVFIETNIRTVLFHHFFASQIVEVSDKELRELARVTLDTEHPREWYWALMDYGAFLKKSAGGRLHQSKHYKKQSPLKGSLREMRGSILRALTQANCTEISLRTRVQADERFEQALAALKLEGMVVQKNDLLCLTDH
jgi:A/G-specific adenine glycosylase